MFTKFENMQKRHNRTINFFFLVKSITLNRRNRLKDFIRQMILKEGLTLESINYIFCSDQYLLVINKKYLNHDYYTDIITFNMSTNSEPLMAEVYISVERVRENAKLLNIPVGDELLRVMFHGVLHLCGYNDKKPVQKLEMRERENHYLRLYKK